LCLDRQLCRHDHDERVYADREPARRGE
jgi:hypothetical protein